MSYRIDLMIVGAMVSFVGSTLLLGCGSVSSLLSPEPTITPQMTTNQVKAAFDAAGISTSRITTKMSGSTDYDGAPEICPGESFAFFTLGDVGSDALVLQCDTSSRLRQLSDYYKRHYAVLTRGGTLIAVPTYFLPPGYLPALDWQIRHCAENNLCTGN